MVGEIDFDGPDPIYVQVANLIRSRVADGSYEVDRRIPSVPKLSEDLGVARATVEKALALLKAEGLLRAVKGRGTFVKPPAGDDQDGAE
ncbi:GntR family transcriptional regulator [Actinomadura sp. SCN-SB]|uniref:GntR family transcriptional regulator n=1 Tax=Actinomadura sp. SCN-SB TaxID=3373092 RepID=UPI00375030BC